MKQLFLVCNAHIDPLWQWEFEEGVGTVLSTFRAAADFCEEKDGFIFNHNEAMIYEWVEQHDPDLFERIRRLVREGKWHVMGSWYLQPDCNLPTGESFVRQMEMGRQYFWEKFGVQNKIAVNFDSFGHSRGLVQLLNQAGYTGYLCCRPNACEMRTPARECLWKGFCESSVMLHRSDGYSHGMGKVGEKIEAYLDSYGELVDTGLILWGVGNHGGGPSRSDFAQIEKIREKYPQLLIRHATPEQYFEELEKQKDSLYVWEQDLNPTMPGCYTSMVRIKQTHRRLENELFLTEKMCVHAELLTGMEYPKEMLKKAQSKLLFSQFHDILPGSGIREVEEQGLEIMNCGLELLREVKAKAFFSLCRDQEKAEEGAYPVLIYNPHPFAVTDNFEVEFMMADQNYDLEPFDFPQVYQGEERMFSQCIKERSNIPMQWRKRAVFHGTLQPFSVNRFDIRIEKRKTPAIEANPRGWKLEEKQGDLLIANDVMSVTVNGRTGYIDSYRIHQVEYARKNFASLTVFADNEDPWGMVENRYSEKPLGSFTLVTDRQKAARIAGASAGELAPVRIIEAGEVQITVEAIFAYETATAVVQYIISRFDTSLKVRIRINNNLKNCMVKWMLPLSFSVEECIGKTVFGLNRLDLTGRETVSQEYLVASSQRQALSVIKTGCYGSHCKENVLGISLLRTAAYCAHPLWERKTIPSDRFVERMEQGERTFEFALNGSDPKERFWRIEQESGVIQQKPQILSYFPNGSGAKQQPLLTIDNPNIVISALKKTADGSGYLLRLFNSARHPESYHLQTNVFKVEYGKRLEAFEVQTLFLKEKTCIRTELIDGGAYV